ncbi:MAG: uracil-DNA glycosylase [Burkholderiaceae bacterium]
MDWPQLQAAVSVCRGCDLCQKRNQIVFGSGDRQAKWLFVGEGPGRTEDQQGAPFVGPAGKLLDAMLSAMGLQRNANVYLANVVKCRPTDAHGADHAPSPQQIALCKPYLERQIALLQPTVIVALGKIAALTLLECSPGTNLSSLRGQLHSVHQTPTIVTYHPAYLLRKPIAKREAWDDLCLALNTYADHAANPSVE